MFVFLVVMLKYLTRSNSREGILGGCSPSWWTVLFSVGAHVVLGDAVHHGEEDMAVEARGRR